LASLDLVVNREGYINIATKVPIVPIVSLLLVPASVNMKYTWQKFDFHFISKIKEFQHQYVDVLSVMTFIFKNYA
jgi:hypothetical protein